MPTPMKQKEYEDAGGQGTGETWSAPLDGTPMPNAPWRAATSHRTSNAGSGQAEAHRAKQRSKAGHTASCASWDGHECDHTEQSKPRWEYYYATQEHTSTSKEQFPSSSRGKGKQCTEATLDATIRWPTSLQTTVVNVTVRCLRASRYGGGATASPTEAAEDEKHKRHGSRVTPIAFPTCGRLKDETE